MIYLEIPGVPVAQGRPRATINPWPHVYDPEKSRAYKEYVKNTAKEQMGGNPPLDGPVVLGVAVYRPIPKSWAKKKRLDAIKGRIKPTSRPDLGNYIKGIEDALNGVAWLDDSQVVEYAPGTGKYYSERPRVVITVDNVYKEDEGWCEELREAMRCKTYTQK
ncbi:MAG: RusA family crossover junction endodeoxyribonuclease [Peptococcaceae bacterium]|nr:RusA family crossover junction endodeoxyribonuclease [Peptococcaceae bacterium]